MSAKKPKALWSLRQPKRLVRSQTGSGGFNNLSGFDAAGTDFHSSMTAPRKLNADRLKIWVKTPSRLVVSV
jgi:hypothetical protein